MEIITKRRKKQIAFYDQVVVKPKKGSDQQVGKHSSIALIKNVKTFDQEIELRVLRVQLKQELSKRYYILFHLLAFFSGSKTDQKLGTTINSITLRVKSII